MKLKSILLIVVACVSCYSCCTDCDDDGNQSFSRVYEEKSFPGFFKINGSDVIVSEVNSSNNSANDQTSLSDLPGQILNAFSVRMFVPTDNSVTISASVGNIFILKTDGTSAPAFFESGTIDKVADLYDEGVDRQGYTYNFTYPSNAPTIDRTNLEGFKFEFNFEYQDTQSGEVINSKTFEYTINLQFN